MAPLAVLPVFLELHGKRVVVAGGSEAAAWKAELLAAAGAEVRLFAPWAAVSDELARLLADPARSTRLVHVAASWSPRALDGTAFAVIDAADEAEARQFAQAARSAGAPVNCIDRPAFCDVQFGAIVNRSPVVVGISTGGAAPILAQAVRRRIEALLPASLGRWAKLAGDLRDTIGRHLAKGGERRRFWERLVDRAFGPAPERHAATDLLALAQRIAADPQSRQGRVTLVGAGPGDAELLTLKAVRALQAADVILYDELVSAEVLELARREATRIAVGKRGGRASCRQDDIDDLMLEHARAGRHVIRLKSGDPMVFGRAGEEIAMLEREGIAVETVPGITTALALAAALGVSLTHRDHARSLRLVTGHAKGGGLPQDLDWQSLADPLTTTIVYMGGRTATELAQKLVDEGLAPTTPVVVATALSRPQQRLIRGTLAALEAATMAIDREAPVVIGIGRVFATCRDTATLDLPGDRMAAASHA